MKTFLEYVAEDLFHKHGERLNGLAVVFPNNRARIFFVEALYRQARHPVWTPQFITLNELFTRNSPLRISDPIRLTGVLYQCYLSIFQNEESFDEFYGWGSILLNDFDNIDKNGADARQLFRNISEQGMLSDDLEHLSQEQIRIIKRFFANFNENRSDIKKNFVQWWNHLYELYDLFRNRLQQNGEAYDGMLKRSVIENAADKGLQTEDVEKYVLVGFNALNWCEHEMFRILRDSGKALFYWDYDRYYTENMLEGLLPDSGNSSLEIIHEAGRFLVENLKDFPNELDRSCFGDLRTTPKKIHFIASSTENAQVHYAGKWLEETAGTEGFRPEETAVVLCNEALLPSLLHCIPDGTSELNVTMGYPMTQTPVFNLIRQMVLLHCDGLRENRYRSKFVLPLLQNHYIRTLSAEAGRLAEELICHNQFSIECGQLCRDSLLELIFQPCSCPTQLGARLLDIICEVAGKESILFPENGGDEAGSGMPPVRKSQTEPFIPLYRESLFQAYTVIARLNDLLNEGLFELNATTYRRLLFKVLNLAIPFSGEPLRGVQLMGILETRNLDFRNVLFLSANEGRLPSRSNDTSFIPYSLRQAFHLTGPEHQDAISAYYFFRFIQRADNITLVYNSSTETGHTGEMSRFMLQLKMESDFDIKQSTIGQSDIQNKTIPLQFEKTPELIQELNRRHFSPSALSRYADCSLRYYFNDILHLKATDEISEDIDGAQFGTIVHDAAQYIYSRLKLQKENRPCGHQDILDFIESGEECRVSITGEDIGRLKKDRRLLKEAVDEQFRKTVFQTPVCPEHPFFNGEQLIQHKLAMKMLDNLLELDRAYAPFDLLALELAVDGTLTLQDDTRIQIRGRIDRIDRKGDVLRVVDYKTGGDDKGDCKQDKLFQCGYRTGHYIAQTFLYSLLMEKEAAGLHCRRVKPVLYYLNQVSKKDYVPGIKYDSQSIEDIHTIRDNVLWALSAFFKDFFDSDIRYKPTSDDRLCQYCDFKTICNRRDSKNF